MFGLVYNYCDMFVQADVAMHYGVQVSYKKAWHGKRKALASIYGSPKENFQLLPRYLEAVKEANPGTNVKWKFVDFSEESLN